jgi:hypothetical protein
MARTEVIQGIVVQEEITVDHYARRPVNLRHQPQLRAIARRLPIISGYERRLAEVTAQVTDTAKAVADRDREFAEYREVHRPWAPVGHFYSPFPDLDAVETRAAAIYGTDIRNIPAVDLRVDEQLALLAEIEEFASSISFCRTPEEAEIEGHRYWTENPAYGDTDARFLTAMLHHFRPAKLIELGCGYSSAVTLDARDRFLDFGLDLTFVDPYPELLESLVSESDRSSVSIHTVGTQEVDLDLLRELGQNDVLFIDSTHVAKTGSDVNRIFFEILPALNPGVLIHLHDVFSRFEYPRDWVTEQRGWTEQYVLRAFLQYNTQFEIVLWPNFLWAIHAGSLVDRYPIMANNAGGAFWMRKVA